MLSRRFAVAALTALAFTTGALAAPPAHSARATTQLKNADGSKHHHKKAEAKKHHGKKHKRHHGSKGSGSKA
jgi:hypothetical protein